jgi:sec-independent protein translocase protein TatA
MVLVAGPFGLGPLELGLIVLVLVLLFGATRLADMGASLGKGIKEFRKNIKEDEEEKPAEKATEPQIVTATAEKVNTPEAVSAVKCPECSTLNPLGARHCNQCGTSIEVRVS